VSRTTDYILTCSMHEERSGRDETRDAESSQLLTWALYSCIDAINEQLTKATATPLANLDSCMSGKVSGAVLWGGCLNHFPLSRMAPLVVGQPWIHPERVLLLVQDDDDDYMTAYTVDHLRATTAAAARFRERCRNQPTEDNNPRGS
jgi:hypothetical protein